MEQADLLLCHGYVITMDANRSIYADGSLVVRDGRIVACGRHEDIVRQFTANEIVDLHGNIVHPGLVDAHSHISWHLTRSWVPDDFDVEKVMSVFEVPYIEGTGREEEYYGTLLACMEMALNGTTAFGDTGSSFHLDATMKAASKVGIRGCTGALICDVGSDKPARMILTTEQCVRMLAEQIANYPKEGGLLWCNAGILGMGEVSDELIVEAKRLADENRTVLHMHQSYAREEVEAYAARIGVRPIRHLYELGALGPNVTLVHMIHLTDEELNILEETRTNVVFCPGASVRYGLGASVYGRFPEMLERRISVGLGSDAGNWADSLDMFRMMYLSCVLHREARQAVPTVSSMQALEMATLHGAKILGMEHEIGSLEPGKRADLVIHARKCPEAYPVFEPITSLLYSAQSKSVDTVYVDGKPVVQQGKLVHVDQLAAYREIGRTAEAFSRRIGYTPDRLRPVIF